MNKIIFKKGFTFPEIIIVLAIVFLVGSVLYGNLSTEGKKRKELVARQDEFILKQDANPSTIRELRYHADGVDRRIIVFKRISEGESSAEHVAVFNRSDSVWLDGKVIQAPELAPK